MILKNLLRRKARTLLTALGIAVGVAAIIMLGAMADSMQAGYSSMLTGSKADLVLSQPNTYDITYSAVDEQIGEELRRMPEVADTNSLLQGIVQTEGSPYFFVFGYPLDGFSIQRFQVKSGVALTDSSLKEQRGKHVLLGKTAAETLHKQPGDTLRLTSSVYRVAGIYETGDAFEDSGAVLALPEAQILLGKPRQVSLFYIRLKSPELRERLEARAKRQWPKLALSSTSEYADNQQMQDMLRGFVWVIAGLAILLGGVGMMNAQLMAVFERTREIGVLRAVGWGRSRVLLMILGESLIVCLVGGVLGVLMGWLGLSAIEKMTVIMGTGTASLQPELILQALMVVFILGLVGGLYPAWRASRLQPIEALRYEGGSTGTTVHRLPFGGMTVQSLWQRTTRTLLTLSVIGLTVGAIMVMDAVVRGMSNELGNMALGSDIHIMLRQADVSDTSLSAIDERIGDKLAALPEVKAVSGMMMTALILPESGTLFVLQGYAPNEYAVRRFKMVSGQRISSSRQVMIGGAMSRALKKGVGDSITLAGSRFRIVGVYETGIGWEELGGVIALRDAQNLAGMPRKVTMYGITTVNPQQAEDLTARINRDFPEVHASIASDFAEEMPDMQNSQGMLDGISFLAILVGGLGVMNTMLMAVLERTREIGVLRALGWRRSAVIRMILREALLLGLLGAAAGVVIALGLAGAIRLSPEIGSMIKPIWTWVVFTRAILVALLLSLIGGLYPAYRATCLQPIEALRYE